MGTSGRRVTAAVALVFLAAVVAASAQSAQRANSQTYVDPAGDAQGTAPDVTTVQVENDDRGMITFRITLANRTELLPGDFINVRLLTDTDPTNNCFGAEYEIWARGDEYFLIHCPGSEDLHTPQGSFHGEFDSGSRTIVYRLNRFDIGNPAQFQFLVATLSDGGWLDAAPGFFEYWSYSVLAPPDRTPPRVTAIASKGTHGRNAFLHYRLADASGWSREEVTIYRGRTLLARRGNASSLAPFDAAKIYAHQWRVPANVRGKLRFCVRAWDPAGNRSSPSCAALTVT